VLIKLTPCLLVVACVKVPPFQGGDSGTGDAPTDTQDGSTTGPLVDVQMMGNGARALAPGYELVFSNDGAKFPHLLNVNRSNPQFLMGGSEGCADEQGMGIALYPVTRINGVNAPNLGAPTITIPLQGPYVGQLRLAWSATYSCTTPASGSLTGHSTFSFFPDGRLTRYDVVDNASARNVADCPACGDTATAFYLTSYTTLIVDGNAFMTDGTQSDLDNYGEVFSPGRSSCITERGYSIAFAWVDTLTRLRVAAAPPTSVARTIAFIKDFELPNATLAAGERRATTQMGISTEACGALENRIAPFSDDDHHLVINGDSTGAALVDGIYGGDPTVSGKVVDFPVTMTPQVTVMPNIPAGFAVWLFHAPLPQTLTPVHSRNPPGQWYYEQRVNQNSVVYWFNVSLEQGETITISGS
jgi:hypothetical protein